eukprot:TRINITY_DN4698_c0_g1_i1.p4 TRINITY_DN4698_c0_g1~~TRINITY_DN4698_c0_g1_i1.p4  ORF type:complete len:110 (-),score=48.27 TRINITY_DN4698_c0_g1_i1:10-315(-)
MGIRDRSNTWKEIGIVETGDAVITCGEFGKLKCLHIIHIVWPISGNAEKKELLITAIKKALILAGEYHLRNIAIPAGSNSCLLYTSPSPRDLSTSRMPSSA